MKAIYFIFICIFCPIKPLWGQNIDGYIFSGVFKNQSVHEVINILSESTPLRFSYQSNLKGLETIIPYKKYINESVKKVLNEIFDGSGLAYEVYSGQVVIYENKPSIPVKMLIEGKLCKSGTQEPVPFAGVELKSARKGTFSDETGYFRMEIDDNRFNDTLLVSSLNFHHIKVPVRNFYIPGLHIFYMAERTITLSGYEVAAHKSKFNRLGNKPLFASGSFYLDTNGQQTALFIENDKQDSCKLISVNIYLSKKGNTDAPFRLHVYMPDSVTGKPGNDLLPEMVIIKPVKGKGWYNINLARYKLNIPNKGIFIAIEGIFPGDFDFHFNLNEPDANKHELEQTDDFESETISYGQQIGYCGGSENKTWHYSVGGNWFQLKKKHFNVMINAEVKIYNTPLKKGFLGLFKRTKHDF